MIGSVICAQRGYSDIFIYVGVDFNILGGGGGGGFRKLNLFGGMNIFRIFWGVITKIDYCRMSFLCTFGSFLKAKVRNGSVCVFFVFFFWGGG